jgi:hypothetical protein
LFLKVFKRFYNIDYSKLQQKQKLMYGGDKEHFWSWLRKTKPTTGKHLLK